MIRPPLPPFDIDAAHRKVRMAENAWNSRNPDLIMAAYTDNSQWRNRAEFLSGHGEIHAFLTRKFAAESDYRLIKELWATTENRIAVRFAYESCDLAGNWTRSYGNENWEFAADGRMARRIASINDIKISVADRLFLWPLGARPDDHAGLSDLGL